MRPLRVWKRLLGLRRAVIEDVEFDGDGAVVVSVRPQARERWRCPALRAALCGL